ncbi:hypothetical protein QTP70_030123 [Hemibagrus guttatus]|uniref:Uncharacterized protein n=1 Tax=Hemibagrus guttatus TaxID=175788 RepID=A0AAE0VCC2_9TELE|nr:hypothetical protein QTP70_030123 [Hemibagrus guttatus]
MMREHFIDAKGGTDLIINSYGPVRASAEREKWNLFRKNEKQVKKSPISHSMYQMGSTLLRYSIESPGSPSLQQPSSLHTLLGPPGGDSEGSHSSEGSHETGDSGRYSHDEHDLANLSGGSPRGSPDHMTEEHALHLAIELQEPYATFASHLQGWGFDSCLRHVCVEFACSPRASGVSSGYSGFLPQSKDMHGRLIGISKLSVVCDCVSE